MGIGAWGVGIGSLADGFSRGLNLGNQIKDTRNKNEIETIRREGLASAQEGYDTDVRAGMQPTDVRIQGDRMVGADATAKGWKVGDKTYMDEEEARAESSKNVRSVEDRFYDDVVPKIQETYLAQGDIGKAEAWRSYSGDRETRNNFKSWSKAWKSAQMGDAEGVADYVFDQYKKIDDGIDPVSKEAVKDKSGKITGFNVRLKNRETGEEYDQFVDNNYLLETGLGFLSPQSQFELKWKESQDAAKVDAKARLDALLEDKKQQNRLDLANAKESYKLQGAQAETDRILGMLKKSGYSDTQIKGMIPELLGVGKDKNSIYQKMPTPEEMVQRLLLARKDDTIFQDKTPEEKQKVIAQELDMIYNAGRRPNANGASADAGSGQATLVRNKKSGDFFLKMPDGSMVPADENGKPLK